MELLTTVHRRVFGTLAPGRIVELFKLGEEGSARHGIATDIVLAGFYEFIGFPRLLTAEAVRKAIARGVATGLFGFITGRPPLGEDGRYQIDRSRVAFERNVAEDEIDPGLWIPDRPGCHSRKARRSKCRHGWQEDASGKSGNSEGNSGAGGVDQPGDKPVHPYPSGSREIAFSFVADQQSLYQAGMLWPTLRM